MDLSFMEHLIPNVAGWLNVQPATVLFWLGVIMAAANLAGRRIPDDKTGWLGVIRDICKFIGAYAENRVTTGVKTSDAVKQVILAGKDSATPPLEEILDTHEEEPKPVVPAFPGLFNKDSD